jgi:hypothetical protein
MGMKLRNEEFAPRMGEILAEEEGKYRKKL